MSQIERDTQSGTERKRWWKRRRRRRGDDVVAEGDTAVVDRGGLGPSCCYHDDAQSEAARIMLEEKRRGEWSDGRERWERRRSQTADGIGTNGENDGGGRDVLQRGRRRERVREKERGI
ncbi:unnamed protein product [Gadus morhua 'NCC']